MTFPHAQCYRKRQVFFQVRAEKLANIFDRRIFQEVIPGPMIVASQDFAKGLLEITEVDLEPEGDAWLPEIAAVDWEKTAKTEGTGFAFVTYRRRSA